MRSRRNWCTVDGEVQALERLSQVMKALTPRHVDVVVCVARMLRGHSNLQGESLIWAAGAQWKMVMETTYTRACRSPCAGSAAVTWMSAFIYGCMCPSSRGWPCQLVWLCVFRALAPFAAHKKARTHRSI